MIALDQNNHTINLAKLNKIQLVKILFTILGSATQLTIAIHTKFEIDGANQRKSYNSFEQYQRSKRSIC
jgi:hypothetical protein